MSQTKIPTEDEIEKELEALRTIKPRVRRRSAFDEDHHDAIDAQCDVLEERMDEDDMDENFGSGPDNVRSATQDAVAWLQGEHESESLVSEWESLAR